MQPPLPLGMAPSLQRVDVNVQDCLSADNVYPVEQVITQALFLQVLLAIPAPAAGHCFPIAPQLLGSEDVDTQLRLSAPSVYPEEHVTTHLLLLQVLLEIPFPVDGHALPYEPQF